MICNYIFFINLFTYIASILLFTIEKPQIKNVSNEIKDTTHISHNILNIVYKCYD